MEDILISLLLLTIGLTLSLFSRRVHQFLKWAVEEGFLGGGILDMSSYISSDAYLWHIRFCGFVSALMGAILMVRA
jgi:hypothetical protein